jgi:undecaprenyl-diphosphatase
MLIAFTTAFWGLVMYVADRLAPPAPDAVGPGASEAGPPGDPLERVDWRQGLAVGFAQALALIPGTSRSGITITTGLLAGLDRATAARYSFLLGIPITAAAGLKKAAELANGELAVSQGGPLVVAIAVSFVSGWFAVWFLVNYLKRRSLTPFVVYRLALAALIVAVWYR